jgi:hypothetical protein
MNHLTAYIYLEGVSTVHLLPKYVTVRCYLELFLLVIKIGFTLLNIRVSLNVANIIRESKNCRRLRIV